MKILHITASLGDGGAEAVLYRLITHDVSNRHEVVSLTDLGKYGSLLNDYGVSVIEIGMKSGLRDFLLIPRLFLAVYKSNADVIQTWLYHADLLGGFLGLLVRKPVVWGVHNSSPNPGRLSRKTICASQLSARFSRFLPSCIVVCASSSARLHVAIGYDRERVAVIPNGYNLDHFVPDALARHLIRARWGLSEGIPVIGLVARFDPSKDHLNFLQALSILINLGLDFKAILVGTNVNNDNTILVEQMEKLGLSSTCLLLGPQRDISAIMNAIDVHALSSCTEAFPNVLSEAMACGTPCVTTDVGDAAQIVGKTGWVVPPGDSVALATALHEALTTRSDRDAWFVRQADCRARILECFSIKKMVSSYNTVWVGAFNKTPTDQIINAGGLKN